MKAAAVVALLWGSAERFWRRCSCNSVLREVLIGCCRPGFSLCFEVRFVWNAFVWTVKRKS